MPSRFFCFYLLIVVWPFSIMVDQQSLDEFDLLGEELESDRIYTGDINEDELLGLNEQPVCILYK